MAEPLLAHVRREDFRSGRLPRTEIREILRHLLEGCPTCRRQMARYVTLEKDVEPSESASSADYATAFAAARRVLRRHQTAFSAEQAAAPGLLRELSALPFERQWARITSEPRFQTWALCDLLLEASREQGFKDPGRALELAELGAAVAAQL